MKRRKPPAPPKPPEPPLRGRLVSAPDGPDAREAAAEVAQYILDTNSRRRAAKRKPKGVYKPAPDSPKARKALAAAEYLLKTWPEKRKQTGASE